MVCPAARNPVVSAVVRRQRGACQRLPTPTTFHAVCGVSANFDLPRDYSLCFIANKESILLSAEASRRREPTPRPSSPRSTVTVRETRSPLAVSANCKGDFLSGIIGIKREKYALTSESTDILPHGATTSLQNVLYRRRLQTSHGLIKVLCNLEFLIYRIAQSFCFIYKRRPSQHRKLPSCQIKRHQLQNALYTSY